MESQLIRSLDFVARANAIAKFMGSPEAASLTASFKRIRNILRQAKQPVVDGFSSQDFPTKPNESLAESPFDLRADCRNYCNDKSMKTRYWFWQS